MANSSTGMYCHNWHCTCTVQLKYEVCEKWSDMDLDFLKDVARGMYCLHDYALIYEGAFFVHPPWNARGISGAVYK